MHKILVDTSQHFVLRGDGTASELGTGFASREEVLEQLRDGPADGSAWQNSSMHLY